MSDEGESIQVDVAAEDGDLAPLGDIERGKIEKKVKEDIKKDQIKDEVEEAEGVKQEETQAWPSDIFKELFQGIGKALKCKKLEDGISDARAQKYADHMSVVFPLPVSSRIISAFIVIVMFIGDISGCLGAMTGAKKAKDDPSKNNANYNQPVAAAKPDYGNAVRVE